MRAQTAPRIGLCKGKKAREPKARGGRPPGPAGSLHHHRTRKEAALAGIRELELAAKRGESIPLGEASAVWGHVIATARSRVLAVVSRVRARLPQLTAADALVLDEELRAALTEIADDGTLPGR